MADDPSGPEIGRPRRRTEDARFLTGRGCYIDDMVLDGMAHAFILRSPHAHATLRSIDAAAAAAASSTSWPRERTPPAKSR